MTDERIRSRGSRLAGLGVAAALSIPSMAAAQAHLAHPRLLFVADDQPTVALRLAAGGVPAAALAAMSSPPCPWQGPAERFGACAEDLAFRARVLGDEAAAQGALTVFRNVISSDIATTWAGCFQANGPCPLFYIGNQGGGVANLYDLLWDRLTPEERTQAVSWLEAFAALLWAHTSSGTDLAFDNFKSSAYAGLGLIALAIQGDSGNPSVQQWLDAAVLHIRSDVLLDLWNPDGSYDEGYGYSSYGGPAVIRFGIAYQRMTGTDILSSTNIVLSESWFTYGFMPIVTGSSPGQHIAYGDAHRLEGQAWTGEYLYFVAQRHSAFGVWGWHYVHGASGIERLRTPMDFSDYVPVALWYPTDDPVPTDVDALGLPLDKLFRDTANEPHSLVGTSVGHGGIAAFHSGWGTESVGASFRVLDEWVNHGHGDSGSFTIDAWGQALALDIGYDVPRSDYHSTLTVDGLYTDAAFRRSYQDAIETFFTGRPAGYVRAKLRYSLGEIVWDGNWDLQQFFPIDRAERSFLFLRGARPYVVVADELADATVRDWHWRMFVPEQGAYGADVGGVPGSPLVVTGAGDPVLEVTMVEPQPFSGFTTSLVPSDEIALNPSVARVETSQHGAAARFLAVLVPRPSASGGERPTITALAVVGGMGARLQWSDGTDVLVLSTADAQVVSADDLTTDGHTLFVRRGLTAAPTGYVLGEGSNATVGSMLLVDTSATEANLSWTDGVLDAQRIDTAANPPLARLVAFGPGTTAVRIDGSPVDFSVDEQDYVHVPPEPVPDAGTGGHGGALPNDSGDTPSAGGGCGCTAASSAPGRPTATLLSAVVLLAARRRRARGLAARCASTARAKRLP